ncbi:Uridylate kinase [Candidatus Gugararchaeum adminiculabundum]|nr:Uridylate kinase [Candidatus Gugararchaeum adminiculabundum]
MVEFVVLSIGGSLINPGEPDTDFLEKIASLLKKMPYRFGLVCGGGKVARHYAKAVRDLKGNEFEADETAVISTKQNARLLIAALGKEAYPTVMNDFEKAGEVACNEKVKFIVMGGTIPGITTDTDAVLLAEKLRAKRVINLSNVDGIYDSNPKENPKAKKYDAMSFDQLVELANRSDQRKAGTNFVFDVMACKLIARSKIETHFVNGKNLKDVEKAINGEKHSGTIVK